MGASGPGSGRGLDRPSPRPRDARSGGGATVCYGSVETDLDHPPGSGVRATPSRASRIMHAIGELPGFNQIRVGKYVLVFLCLFPALLAGIAAVRFGLPPMVGYLLCGFVLNLSGVYDYDRHVVGAYLNLRFD